MYQLTIGRPQHGANEQRRREHAADKAAAKTEGGQNELRQHQHQQEGKAQRCSL